MSKHENCCEEIPQKRSTEMQLIPAILQPAPPWTAVAIVDSKIQDLSLKDFKGKYLVLLFYPYDFSFVCPTELIQFSDRVEEFEKLGSEVVAISTDSEYAHFAWITTPRKQGGLGEMNIPVLSDKSHEISKSYGVLDVKQGVTLRGLFVIDREQLIRHITINEIALPRSVDEVLRVIQACQFVDKYGDVCPIGPKQRRNNSDGEPDYFNPI